MIKNRRNKWIHLAITIVAVLVIAFCVLLVFYGSNSSSNDIAFVILAALSAICALGQWFLPFSTEQSETIGITIASKLERGSFKLGDKSATNFRYITHPIQSIYNDTKEALEKASTNTSIKRGILILGESNAGKTRLAVEAVVETLPNWLLLRWTPDKTLSEIHISRKLAKHGLVLFIDDLQEYVLTETSNTSLHAFAIDPHITSLHTLIAALREIVQPLVIVATCRLEDKDQVQAKLNWLLSELVTITLPRFNPNAHSAEATLIINDFRKYGSIHIEDWDGTLGSLVLGLSKKNSQYLTIRNAPAAMVLRAMKLLYISGITTYTEERIRAICVDIFDEKFLHERTRLWQATLDQLTQLQFVFEEKNANTGKLALVMRKDTYFDKVITDYPNSMRINQVDEHFAKLQDIFINLEDIEGLSALGNEYFNQGKYKEAFVTYEHLINFKPEDFAFWLRKGGLLQILQKYDEALIAYDNSLTLNPRNDHSSREYEVLTLTLKGQIYLEQNNPSKSLEAFNHTLTLDTINPLTWFVIGQGMTKLEQNNQALIAYDRALTLDPKNPLIWVKKGASLYKLQRFEDALVAYNHALGLDYKPAYTPYKFKNIALRKLGIDAQQYEDLVTKDHKALDAHVTNDCYFIKGFILNSLNRVEEAIISLSKAIENEPNNTLALEIKSIFLCKLERNEEAIDTINSLLVLEPNNADMWYYKGLTLFKLDDLEKALEAFEQVLRIEPNRTNVLYSKATTLKVLEREEEASNIEVQAKKLEEQAKPS